MINDFLKRMLGFKAKKKDKVFFLKDGQNVFLKATDNVPKELAVDLVALLEQEGNVECAYLAEGFLNVGESEHYLVGIKFNNNQTMQNFIQSFSKEIKEIIPQNLYVDFIQITEEENPINNFIRNCVIPFYVRGK